MLVLSRRAGERIIVGAGTPGQVVITVTEVDSRGKVRLGIDCAREIPIAREELLPSRPGPRFDGPPGRPGK